MKAVHSLMIVSVLLSSCKQKSEPRPDIYSPLSNSISSELRKLYDVSLLPLYDVSESAQTSSYDTTGVMMTVLAGGIPSCEGMRTVAL